MLQLVVVLNRDGENCHIDVQIANVKDQAVSYGIGPSSGLGDGGGYVSLWCSILPSESDICGKGLDAVSQSYTPYGTWNGTYRGASTIPGVQPDSQIKIKVIVRDNAAKFSDFTGEFVNTGCQGGN